MSISIGNDGRVVTGRKNVVIPPENAGVGDVVLCANGQLPSDAANLLVVGWGTYDATSLPSGYTVYGVIYGFVNGRARVCAVTESSYRWSMLASDTGSASATGATTDAVDGANQLADSTVGAFKNRMRNGQPLTTIVGMNISAMSQYNYTGGNTIVHPTSAGGATAVMSRANFNALPVSGGNAKTLYGTYENYLRQLLPVRVPGSCFAAHDADHKVHEQGRWNTYLIGPYTKASPDTNSSGTGPCWYPAANYCYNYYVSGTGESDASHNWWLPSMDELYDLMIDDHWQKVNTSGATTVAITSYRWSSIRYSTARAWSYFNTGSSSYGAARAARNARPVTLLKLA